MLRRAGSFTDEDLVVRGARVLDPTEGSTRSSTSASTRA